ncbi:MAG: cation-transporting P-type ATPase [Gloeomargarita sp. SKYG116]|nr:cation-transporting P-type ATPase [Gloeomargarita sp. SKYG116]MDW8401049.1 cation-transporting P-type ATPase [Gloeomargarita sp. SKYGB_i_bin116]
MAVPTNCTAPDWHTLSIPDTLTYLKTSPDGLAPAEAQQRLAQYGPNELEETHARSRWDILLDQFKNVMLLLLIAVAILSGVLDVLESLQSQEFIFPKDTVAILAIVVLNGLLGYIQESKAEQALLALKKMSASRVRVVRAGQIQEVDATELVPGDVVLVEAGNKIPADGRWLVTANLQVREAMLTGEAMPVTKQADVVLPPNTEVGDRVNLGFMGTEVVHGRGTLVVTQTGMRTELGKIASALQTVEVEPTPLQRRMDQLGKVLVTGALALVALVVAAGTLYNPRMFVTLIEVSLSMAVAVVPEGLPAVVTITLALGTRRMMRRHALIRRLPAVETLGSVTVVCSDKTGTLTQNKMMVQTLALPDLGYIHVTGNGYAPEGEFFYPDHTPFHPQAHPEVMSLLLTGLLCNDATWKQEQGEWTILGDPTEGALLPLAAKAGLTKERYGLSRVAEFPFSPERKRMSVVVDTDDQPLFAFVQGEFLLLCKGSPELTLACCDRVQWGQEVYPLTPEQQHLILEQNNTLASQGLRVLGLAYRPLDALPAAPDAADLEQGLIWLGLVGLMDPPRPEAKAAVDRCHTAGIRVVMITGDHQLTACTIAKELGIWRPGDELLTGRDLEALTLEALVEHVERVTVYARVSPEHKLKIVQAFQKKGHIVSMTGDGVNDAPALKQADIGVAMGLTGTDVSKEASDMILLDDNFATIVAAVEEGRVVYGNIRRFIRYILGSNIGEVITIAMAPLLGLGGSPLTPLQILWMNLATDGIPALALAVEPGRAVVMQQPPKDPQESIFARGLGSYMVRVGLVFSTVTIALMVWAFDYTQTHTAPGLDPRRWQTMVFTTLCLSQMGHALAVRSDSRLLVELNPRSNPWIWGAVSLMTLAQVLIVYLPPLRHFFSVFYLPPQEMLVCVAFSTLVFVWVELEKLVIRWLWPGHDREG